MNKPSLPDRIPLLTGLPGITAFSTTRGPEADIADPYSGFSVCHYTGDAPDHYMACRRQLADALGIPADRLIIPRQVHGSAVSVITQESGSVGELQPANCASCIVHCALDGVDGLVTNQPGIALCINTADCVPVVLADPEARVIAAAHCGWRGTVAPLLGNTVEAMARLGADPTRIHAAMGPSICPRCFEVGPEVASQFREFENCRDAILRVRPASEPIGPISPIRPNTLANSELCILHSELNDNCALCIVHCEFDKPHIDLSAAITVRLMNLGLQRANITPPPACSRCNPARFFSARHSGIASSRTLSLILLS